MDEKSKVLRLPYSAVKGEINNYNVFVVKDDLVQSKPIKTGLEDDRYIEIISGLNEGDKVILSEGKPLSENQAVKVSE